MSLLDKLSFLNFFAPAKTESDCRVSARAASSPLPDRGRDELIAEAPRQGRWAGILNDITRRNIRPAVCSLTDTQAALRQCLASGIQLKKSTWSPSGETLALVGGLGHQDSLRDWTPKITDKIALFHVPTQNHGTPVELAPVGGIDYVLSNVYDAWSKNSKYYFYLTGRHAVNRDAGTNHHLVRVSVGDDKLFAINTEAYHTSEVLPTFDGQRVVLATYKGPWQLIDAENGSITPLRSSDFATAGAWLPRGNAFVCLETTRGEAYFESTENSIRLHNNNLDEHSFSARIYDGTGQTLSAVDLKMQGHPTAWAVNPDSTRLAILPGVLSNQFFLGCKMAHSSLLGSPIEINLENPHEPNVLRSNYKNLVRGNFQIAHQSEQSTFAFSHDLRTTQVTVLNHHQFFDNISRKIIYRLRADNASLSIDGKYLAWSTGYNPKVGVTAFPPKGWGNLVPNISILELNNNDQWYAQDKAKDLVWLGQRSFAWQQDGFNVNESPVIAKILD